MPYKDPEKRRAYQREYQRAWYARRKAEWIDANEPCAACGSSQDLEIDHIDRTTKITSVVWSWSKQRRDEELAKCQVLCAPCHKAKTIAAGDHLMGERVGISKLTDREVREARVLYATGKFTFREIGERYGVHKDTIRYAVNRGGWKHLGADPAR